MKKNNTSRKILLQKNKFQQSKRLLTDQVKTLRKQTQQ
ncbi:hypothetical protein LDG_5894 [Legionella drancourtii LLAP12]|uniref:Uncharacterized protein n=1 Tax=Legionella drancourtii LLAP12 TaxID=658187 RepID=G9EKZ9_9GAMM|nr:hypothetical protein LDG_5894 [Legionella drancourtii LLAP12]